VKVFVDYNPWDTGTRRETTSDADALVCGNTWEWTESERADARTRFCIIRGGSYFKAKGSHWYADGGPRPCNFAAKFLLSWPALDRCATIGFRCVVDLACATARTQTRQ